MMGENPSKSENTKYDKKSLSKVITYWPFAKFEKVHLKKDPGALPSAFATLGTESVLIVGQMNVALNGVKVIQTRNKRGNGIGQYFKELFIVTRHILDEDADLHIIFNWSNLNTFIVLLSKFYRNIFRIGKTKGKFFLKMDSDGSYVDSPFSIGKIFYFFLLSINSLIFDKIVIESSCGRDRLKKYFLDPKRLKVIGNGISKDLYSVSKEEAKRKVVSTVSRISPEKGIDITIQAFKTAWEVNKEWSLEIIGPIEDLNYYDHLKMLIAALNLDGYVNFLGEISDIELSQKLNSSAIYCSLSRSEGFSIARMEALSLGLPVIVSTAGCGSDLKKYGATVISDKDYVNAGKELIKLMKKYPNLFTESNLRNKVPSWLDIAKDLYNLIDNSALLKESS